MKFVEKIEVQIACPIKLFQKIIPVFEIMWKNCLEPDRPHMTIQRMHIAWSMPKATDTHSEWVVIIAFPLQQWLHELVSMSSNTYIACRRIISLTNFNAQFFIH